MATTAWCARSDTTQPPRSPLAISTIRFFGRGRPGSRREKSRRTFAHCLSTCQLVQNVGLFPPDLVYTASTSRGGTFCLLARLGGKGRREAIKKGGSRLPRARQARS